jgi:hypothetical protein
MLLSRLGRFCVAVQRFAWFSGLIGPKSDPSFFANRRIESHLARRVDTEEVDGSSPFGPTMLFFNKYAGFRVFPLCSNLAGFVPYS